MISQEDLEALVVGEIEWAFVDGVLSLEGHSNRIDLWKR